MKLKIIVSGGKTADSRVASVYKYEEGGWVQARDMFTARKYHSTTLVELTVGVDGENICVFPDDDDADADDDADDDADGTKMIIIIVSVVLFFVFLVSTIIIIFFVKKKNRRQQEIEMETTGPNEMEMRPTATDDYYTEDQEENEYDNDYNDEYDDAYY